MTGCGCLSTQKGYPINKGVKNIPGKRRKTISSNQKRIKNNRGKINAKKNAVFRDALKSVSTGILFVIDERTCYDLIKATQ